jgi:heat shock protein HslJ
MEQANAYLGALSETATFAVKKDELTLSDADGNAVATFMATSNDLSGTSWQVISYNNGNQAVVSVTLDTELTAQFGEDGQLQGNAGCNDYFGPYETDGNAVSMGPLGTSRKACQEPEGVMEQETLYLQALETAATYKIDGNKMEMRTSEGSMAANFQKVR